MNTVTNNAQRSVGAQQAPFDGGQKRGAGPLAETNGPGATNYDPQQGGDARNKGRSRLASATEKHYNGGQATIPTSPTTWGNPRGL